MRILFISNYSALYGANRSLLTLAEHFSHTDGNEVGMMIPSKGLIRKELERLDISTLTIPYFSQLFYYKRQLKYLALPLLTVFTVFMFPYIILRVRRFKPDLIYSNTSAENIGIFISKILHVKHITHVREFMDLDHGAHFIGGNVMKKKFLSWSDGLVFVSDAVRKWVNQGEEPLANQIVVHNGVDTGCDIKPAHLQGKGVRLGIVGILDEEKGQHIAIEYFRDVLKNHPEARLHIYGDKEGPYKKRLLEMIRKYSLENTVRMHGFVKDSKAIYLDMDIMLMCSRSEGFGRVTAEAMQYGIPVIGYDSGGTSEIIEEGRNGYLFKDKEGFLKAVEQLLDSEKHYQEMSEYAFRNAHERFSKERYCRHIQDFVTRICSSSSVS